MGFMARIKDLLPWRSRGRVELLLTMTRPVSERMDGLAAKVGLADKTEVITSALALFDVLADEEAGGAVVTVRRANGTEHVVRVRKEKA